MLQYRIPAAGFASAAIMLVCFVISLIVINAHATSRSRSFGLLGVTLVMASTVLQALNGSLAGAYGRQTIAYVVGSIIVAALAVGGLLLVAVAIRRSHTVISGQPRVLGILGSLLVVLGLLARFAFQWLAESFLGVADNETLVTILATDTLAGGVLTGAGLLLLARAVVVE